MNLIMMILYQRIINNNKFNILVLKLEKEKDMINLCELYKK